MATARRAVCRPRQPAHHVRERRPERGRRASTSSAIRRTRRIPRRTCPRRRPRRRSSAPRNKRTAGGSRSSSTRGGAESAQLVMGVTELMPGSVWNTMPSHTHARRTEVYLYFGLPADARRVHLMGEPGETRHLVVRERRGRAVAAVVDPLGLRHDELRLLLGDGRREPGLHRHASRRHEDTQMSCQLSSSGARAGGSTLLCSDRAGARCADRRSPRAGAPSVRIRAENTLAVVRPDETSR